MAWVSMVVFAVTFVFLCMLERLLNVVFILFLSERSSKQKFAGEVVGGFCWMLGQVTTGVVTVVFQVLSYFAQRVLWLVILVCLFALINYIWARHAGVVFGLVNYYNMRLGPFIYQYAFWPLRMVGLLFKGVYPVINGLMWISRTLVVQVFFPLLFDQFALVGDLVLGLLNLGNNLVLSLVDFLSNLNCSDGHCLTDVVDLNVVSVVNCVRDLYVIVSRMFSVVCPIISVALDVIFYPLLDVNLAEGLHNIVNSLLYLFVHLPIVTFERCRSFGVQGGGTDILMCTPDIVPVVSRLASGLRDAGSLVDNWMAVALSAVIQAISRGAITCASSEGLTPDVFRGSVLAGEQTTIGLTDWLMATSNGTMAVFYGQRDTSTAPRRWPGAVDTRFGLAAVSYSDVNDVDISLLTQGRRPGSRQSTTLMGCSCGDAEGGLNVRCYFLPYSSSLSASAAQFDVWFQDSTWVRAFTCDTVEITVRSVRWQVRRDEAVSVAFGPGMLDLPTQDCVTKGTCESVDATIWLVPRCDLLPGELCSDVAVGTSCFPFCMATRVAGSGNASPVFVNADGWRSGKQLIGKDCTGASSAVASQTVPGQAGRSSLTTVYGATTLSGAASTPNLLSDASGSVACRSGVNTVSWISKAGGYLPYTRATGQPFAIAGDTILLEDPQGDGGVQVMVERLTGDQRDVYTLQRANNELPAAPKRLVPIDELGQSVHGAVVVPLEYAATRILSTSTKNYVFYAVSPDMQIFAAYLDYCADPLGGLPQFQFMVTSSYGPLRVYRVRAYCQTACTGGVSDQFTFSGFGSEGFGDSAFPQDCSRVYNASVDGLEYINDQNLAVTVQVADRTYNVSLGRGANSRYTTYWLNPQTMRMRSDTPWPLEIPASQDASLCLNQPSVPHLGTMVAEVVVAGVHLAAAIVGGVANYPGVMAMWRAQGGVCPLQSQGHSVIGNCGAKLFTMEDYFDSMDDATAIFWGITSFFSDSLTAMSQDLTVSPVVDILDGMGMYGRATVNILDARQKGVLCILNTPFPQQMEQMWGVIMRGGAARGAAGFALSSLTYGRYGMMAATDFVKRVMMEHALVAVSGGGSGVFSLFTRSLYETRPVLASTVGARAQDACLGVETMMGGGNPWGVMLFQLCQTSAALPGGLMDMFLLMFVDVPLVKCMCKDSQGHRMDAYALQYCVPNAPPSMRPLLLGMISAAQGLNTPSLLCPAVIAYTRQTLKGTMAPYFSAMDEMLIALGSSVDYTLVGYDSSAGQCENFAQDPQVVVIMPQPIAYFQACGMTSSCQSKCLGAWTAFSEALAQFDPASLSTSRVIQQQTESLFFPTPGADIISSGTVVALVQLTACVPSVCSEAGNDCIAAAMLESTALSVQRFCVPMDPAASVHPAADNRGDWRSSFGHNATQVSFYGDNGGALLVLVSVSDGNAIYMLTAANPPVEVFGVSMGIATLLLMGQYPLNVVNFRVMAGHVVAGVAVRKTVDGVFQSAISYVWFTPGDAISQTQLGVVDFPDNILSGYAMSEYVDASVSPSSDDSTFRQASYLLWPTFVAGGPLRLSVVYNQRTLRVLALEAYQLDQSLVAKAAFMPRNIVLALGTRVTADGLQVYASTGNSYDWLQMLRLTGSDLALSSATLRNSRPVPANISIQTGCDGTDCRGCVDLNLRALCALYQQCAVVRCIGTPVNLRRPLCDVGGVLRSTGQMGLELTRGAWLVFVDVFMVVLELSTRRDVTGVSISSTEDAFFGQICAAKDLTAEFSAVILSTVNSALQMVQVPVPMLQDSTQMDSNVNTVLSLTTAALTGFFHQAGLLPIYVLSVAQKIMMCQVQGYVSILSTAGFSITLVPANMLSASDAVSGQCLAQSTQLDVQQTGDAASTQSAGARGAALLTSSEQNMILQHLDPVIHIFDGSLTYLIGLLGSFAGVLQSFDLQNCLVPDVTLQYAMQCACGDQAMAISAQRRLEHAGQFAYWCSGTVSVIDSQNQVQVVYNPYSYQELQDLIGGRLDDYLQCAATSNSCVPPNLPIFLAQGVNVIQVLTRCRQNYVNLQWDQAAYVQYDASFIASEIRGPTLPAVKDAGDGVGACLLDSAGSGETNGACLDAFLSSRGADARYWTYDQVDSSSSVVVDACMVFSGPASKSLGLPDLTNMFRSCLLVYSQDSGQRGCDLSGYVWSPSSSNVVPVAQRHVIDPSASMIANSVQARMQLAYDTVMSALTPLLDYDNPELEADFFSSEGDVIHQLLDCIFMGPYARMDYWPAPRCNESLTDSCLVGPYWSRDDNRGASRNVDIQGCAATSTLPFTCGSPSRKAMVKEFVKVYVLQGQGKSQLFKQLIRAWLNSTFYSWQDLTRYGCECPPNSSVAYASACCNGTGSDYLPDQLQKETLSLPTDSVLNALEQRMQDFYDNALTDATLWTSWLDSDELGKYSAWKDSAQEKQIKGEALFDATGVAMGYSGAEAMGPPQKAGDTWLWEQCHGALRQVFFTIPVNTDGSLRDSPPEFLGGGVDAISAYVQQVVQSAYEDSPLFRHYQVRHHPSRSGMCSRNSTDPPGGSILFDDYVVNEIVMASGSAHEPIRSLGFEAGKLGRANHSCFCGWSAVGGRCRAPDEICAEVVGAIGGSDCSFPVESQPARVLSDAFRPGVWPCPYLDLTDHLGLLDPTQMDAWVSGQVDLTTSMEYLLRYGVGGLKAGNLPLKLPVDINISSIPLANLRDVLRQNLQPAARAIDPGRAALHGCEESIQLQGRSFVDDFVESLFPMAQGVEETGAGAYCLRFAIELSRLRILELIQSENHTAMVVQRGVVLQWRRKCGTQARLVGMCQALQVYRPLGGIMDMCPQQSLWQMAPETGHVIYVTPQCLVHVDGVFYDPCTCNPDWCVYGSNGIVRLTLAMLQSGRCALRFDPRSVIAPNEMGWWGKDDTRDGAQAWNDWQADSWNLLDLEGLTASLLGEGRGAGNTPPGEHWATAEGFMNETALFCDMIVDYWPDEAAFPVGYHATVPCHATETAYRSFDNVFAMDLDRADPTLVYLDDETRDRDLVDSHFGGAGVCRITNFGFDMYETNTMRVCTRVYDNEDVDIHVPNGGNPTGALGLERCSSSSQEVPWDDALLLALGGVPNLPLASDVRYPGSSGLLMRLGPQVRLQTEGWGAACQDFGIPDCSSGWTCADGFRCMGGVCQDQSVECVQHGDCAGDAMCSGMGTCVAPRVTMINNMPGNVSFMAHTSNCSGEAFSMRGVSAWGYVPDLLQAHGMCSYRHWQEYLYTRTRCNCVGRGAACAVNGTSCPFYLFDETNNNNMWWDPVSHFPNRLKMLPTTCDRDYQRFQSERGELKGCSPRQGQGKFRLMGPNYGTVGVAARDQAWRTYDQDTRTVPVAAMPFLQNPSFGFLGFGSDPHIQSCNRVKQCFCDTYTRNGSYSMYVSGILRPKRVLVTGQMYNPNDIFQCGAVGYLDTSIGKCRLDTRVAPLYQLLCGGVAPVMDACRPVLSANVQDLCNAVPTVYEMKYSYIHDIVVPSLTALFHAFTPASNLAQHLDMVQCMGALYDGIQTGSFESSALYFPFTFTLFEFPFTWFYQCMVQGGVAPSQGLTQVLYVCSNYEQPSQRRLGVYAPSGDSFVSYTSRLRAGYVRATVQQQVGAQYQRVSRIWGQCVNATQQKYYGARDFSYPVCHTQKKWRLDTGNYYIDRAIETYLRPVCASNLRHTLLASINQQFSLQMDVTDLLGFLTSDSGDVVPQAPSMPNDPLLTNRIYNFGLQILQQHASVENLDVGSATIQQPYPVQMNASLPALDDPAYLNARDIAWKPSYQPLSSDVYGIPDLTYCAGNQWKYLYTSGGQSQPNPLWDSDQLNRLPTWVQVCPTYVTGLFSCHLDTITRDNVEYTYAAGDSDASYEQYADLLYGDALSCFDQAMQSPANRPQPLQPSSLRFFEDESNLGFGDAFQFDLTNVSRYMVNIQPDVNVPVMCTPTNQVIDYTNCTDSNYQALWNHVRNNFTVETGVTVPPQYQMDWVVSRGMMESGAIFSFASTERNVSKQFMGFLFDRGHVCTGMSLQGKFLDPVDKMCSFSTTAALATTAYVSPWMSGEWNPFDQCDVDTAGPTDGFVETIDIACDFPGYCVGSSGVAFDSTVDYYKNMPYFTSCMAKNGLKTTQLNVDSSSPYNLCKHSLIEDSVCLHMQGMLGGTDGFPMEDYDVDADMYSLHNFTSVPAGDGRLFGNVLLAGQNADYGFVRFPSSHIGGHHLVMTLTDGLLRVAYMPLKEVDYNQYATNLQLTDVRDWVTVWQESMQADHVAYISDVYDKGFVQGSDSRGRAKLGWDCPIRRRAYYGGNVNGFQPSLPSPQRSLKLFGNLTGSLYAHPMQYRTPASEFGEYRTTNGFCFCPVSLGIDPTLCEILITDMEHECSLFKTIAAVQGRRWGRSHTFMTQGRGTTTVASSGPASCKVQTDWPFVKGRLRDDQFVTEADIGGAWAGASDPEAQKCHVLDRTLDFAYVFVSKNELNPSGFNTVDRGVCHTGRVQSWQSRGSTARCLRTAKGGDSASVQCSDGGGFTRARSRSAQPPQQAANRQFGRRTCGQCTPPPAFRTKGGTPMEPESSFGLPFRLSAERVLANDLLRAICPEDALCRSKLNLSAWTPGEFLRTYVSSPAALFKPEALRFDFSDASTMGPVPGPDDSALWSDPWVYCPSREALASGKNCSGSISKPDWRADKVGSCHRTVDFALRGAPDPMAKTTVCNLDSSLSALCQALEKGRSLVASANCLGSGNPECMLQEFVYTPSTWETTNQEFVHDTVAKFYKLSDSRCLTSSVDCVCPVDPALASFLADKDYRLQQCSAVPVVAVQNMLIFIRGLGGQIVVALSYIFAMLLDLMFMFSTEGATVGRQRLLLDWAEFKRLSGGVIDGVSDLGMDLIFQNGAVGPWLRTRVFQACGVINQAYRYFSDFWCGFIIAQLPIFLGSLKSVGFWIDTGFSVVNDVFQTILRNYLPDAMMDLYQKGYNSYFASNQYKEKTDAYEKNKQLDLLNPKQDKILSTQEKNLIDVAEQPKVMQNLANAEAKSIEKNTLQSASSLPGPVAIVAGLIDAGIGIYQGYQDLEHLKQLADVAAKFPTSLTLFDFTSFYESIDALVLYINNDLTCYSIVPDSDAMQCDQILVPAPQSSDVGRMAPVATACWADAQQQQVGVSTLYSCTATSTCCVDALCETNVLCASCPVQTAAGYRDFGCNTMTQRCQCSVQTVATSRCISHSDCGGTSACSLLTSLQDISFGVLEQCSLCSVQAVCLMGSSPQSGTCTCLTTGDVEVDRCSAGAGSPANPDYGHLCGYSQQGGAYFSWGELALALCANVIFPVCAEVTTEANGVLNMPVATSLKGLSFSSRRRLLGVNTAEGGEEPIFPSAFVSQGPYEDISPDMFHSLIMNASWNQTAAPCSSLAHAYRHGERLGPTDESALQSCVYWRRVGRRLIHEFNLSSLREADSFLMSPDDLAWAMGQAGVAKELAQTPRLWISAALYSPWLKPVRAWVRATHGPDISRMVRGLMHNRGWNASGGGFPRRARPRPSRARRGRPTAPTPPPATGGGENRTGRVSAHSRRLQGVFEDTVERLQGLPYYAYLQRMNSSIVSPSTIASLSQSVSQSWLRGSFSWRPFDFSSQCAPLDTMLASGTQVLGVLRIYYANFDELNQARNVTTGLADSLPSLSWPNATAEDDAGISTDAKLWSADGLGAYGVQLMFGFSGIKMQDVVRFLSDPCNGRSCVESNRWTLTYIVDSALFCDFEALTYCTNYRRGLMVSFVMAVLLYLMLSVAARSLGMDFVSTWLFYCIPVITLWFSMGVSFTCLPMLPTCLLDDLVSGLEELVPLQTRIPPALVVNNGTALASCAGFGFAGWMDSVAFFLCEMGFCGGSSVGNLLGMTDVDWDAKRAMMASPDRDAYRVCAFLATSNSLWLFLVTPLLFACVSGAAYCVTILLPQFLSLVWYILMYNHEG